MLPAVINTVGNKCIMYASDYPHGDSKWPETVSRIRAAGLSAETQRPNPGRERRAACTS